MTQFKQKKIALAIGSTLLVMAGAAQAVPGAFALKASPVKPALITAGITNTQAIGLYDGTGFTGELNVTLQFTAPTTSGTTANSNAVGQAAQLSAGVDGFIVNGATYNTTSTSTTAPDTTVDDVSVYTGASAAAGTRLLVTNMGFAANVGGSTIGTTNGASVVTNTATAIVGISSGVAPAAFRMTAAGTLQWIADIATGLATPSNWLDVRFDVNSGTETAAGSVGAPPLQAHKKINAAELSVAGSGVPVAVPAVNTGLVSAVSSASSTVVTAAATQPIWNGVKPNTIVATRATSNLVDGVTIDTLTPVTGFAVANIAVSARAMGTVTGTGVLAATLSAAASSANVTSGVATATTTANATGVAKYTALITGPATTANWSSGALVAGQFYTSGNFHTGLVGASLPFGVNVADASSALVYTTVFNTSGLPVSFSAHNTNLSAAALDAVSPALVSVTTNVTGKTLSLKFSEPMTIANPGAAGSALREIIENVIVNTDSLAALTLNNGSTLSIPATGAIAPSAGMSTLVITDTTTALVTATAGKTITVNSGIFFGELNDGTAANVTTIADAAGGLSSTSGAVEGASGVLTAAAASLDAAFDATNTKATTARASTGADPTKVATIQVKFPTDGAVAFATGKTMANLAGQIVVEVTGTGVGNAPVVWNFFPTAAQMTLTNSTTLDITVPTALLYSKVANKIAMNLKYLNNPGGTIVGPNVLVSSALSTDVIDASTAGLTVSIPYAATTATTNLLTQSITGTLTSAAVVSGDKVEAFVAEWVDVPKISFTTFNLTGVAGGGNATTFGSKTLATTAVGAAVAGDAISGPGIPAGTTITAVANPNVTLSAAATDTVKGGETYKVTPQSIAAFSADLNKHTINGLPLGTTIPAAVQLDLNKAMNAVQAGNAQTAGVANLAAPVLLPQVPVYVVLAGIAGGTAATKGLPEVYADLVSAEAAQSAADEAVRAIAATAATAGAAATGAATANASGNGAVGPSSMNAGAAGAMAALLAANWSELYKSVALAAGGTPTVTGIVSAILKHVGGPLAVKSAMLNPVTGVVTGPGVTGKLSISTNTGVKGIRGLAFIKNSDGKSVASAGATDAATVAAPWASAVVTSAGTYTMLLGVEPTTADLLSKAANQFVLLVHTPAAGVDGNRSDLNMLTSADPLAGNFMPWAPNLQTGLGTRTTLASNLAKLNKLAPVASTNWALYGLGDPFVLAAPPLGHVPSFERTFVGIAASDGYPKSFWTNDGQDAGEDMAMTIVSKVVSVATELGASKNTLSTFKPASFVKGAQGLGWKNDAVGVVKVTNSANTGDHIDILQNATAPAAGKIVVGPGWSLVTVPSAMTAAAGLAKVDAIIKVGSQVTSGYTWIKKDDGGTIGTVAPNVGVPTTVPALTAGEAVFVFSTAGGAIN